MRATLLVIAVSVMASAAVAEDSVKKEMAQLEGEWSMASGEANGMSLPEETVKTGKRVAKDGETTTKFGGKVYFKAKYSTDPRKRPRPIDSTMTEGPTKGKTPLGIYELDGATVKFCFAAPARTGRRTLPP